MLPKRLNHAFAIVLLFFVALPVHAQQLCSESRKGFGAVIQTTGESQTETVRCSKTTDALLWWRDPFEGTVPMQPPFLSEDAFTELAVVKPLDKTLKLYDACALACHNGVYPPVSDNTPRQLIMHTDVVPDAANLQHGKGSLWCLDCHHNTQRKSLVDNFGNEIAINAASNLCGNCHGSVYSDWKNNIHGKTIGEWASNGKKRWFGCTECHNPHDVVNGAQARGFAAIPAEQPPLHP